MSSRARAKNLSCGDVGHQIGLDTHERGHNSAETIFSLYGSYDFVMQTKCLRLSNVEISRSYDELRGQFRRVLHVIDEKVLH